MSLKNERDLKIKELFQNRNLGSLPDMPFSNEVALNLTNRLESRLMDLNKDLQDKKVIFLFFFLTGCKFLSFVYLCPDVSI